MEIKSLSNSANFYKDNNVVNGAKKQHQEIKPDAPKDKIEISAEAKIFESASAKNMESSKKVKNLLEIQQKIQQGYYNSEEVIRKVAEKILNEISE